VVDQVKSEQMALAMVKNEAVQGGDLAAQHELGTVKIPFENVEQIYYLRKWLFVHDGTPLPDKDTTMIKAYMQSWTGTWMNTWNAAMQRNLFTTLPRVQCPVYFFLGGKDYQTHCTIAKRYYEHLIAPKKKLFWFANAGHSLLVTEAAQVQDTIINQVLQRR
jgi:esterase/lipase